MPAESIKKNFDDLFHQLPNLEGAELVRYFVAKFKDFLQSIEHEDHEHVNQALEEWDKSEGVYLELGKLARKYHENMVTIEKTMPETLTKLVDQGVEGTAEKLEHIIEMTEKSANTTLDLTEKIQEKTDANAKGLQKVLADLLTVKEDDNISVEHAALLQKTIDSLEAQIRQLDSQQIDLNDILMAQTYQDLTGQIVQKVLHLVNALETDMVNLIANYGKSNKADALTSKLSGPLHNKHAEKNNQQDVDSLLSEYGF